jgi:leucyl aminopeptidase
VDQHSYVYTATKPSAEKPVLPAKVSFVADKAALAAVKGGLALGEGIAAGVALAREVGNLPANVCTPTYLGEQAKGLGSEFGLSVQVLDRKAIEKLGMGSFLSVTRGSKSRRASSSSNTTPPRRTRRWCWWARASPSTPAASRSSPRPTWTR